MFQFRDKIIFIISPERWGTMKVSKHHYALELADQNCKVYFIEPPQLSYKGIEILPCSDHLLISIIKYKPVFRGKRFLPSFIYSYLLKRQIKGLLKKIGVKPDIVWCFQGYLFQNLHWFGASINLFFAADQFLYSDLPPEVYSADLSIAVSDTIYNRIQKSGKPVFMINHGLQNNFAKAAEELIHKIHYSPPGNKISVGYSGNLRMEALDKETMIQVIKQYPNVKFIFWGSYKLNDLNLGGVINKETDAFIDFLEKQVNVELRGVVKSDILFENMKEADLFWLCWKIRTNGLWDGSNSHKILEYLSTGRPIVSHYISTYFKSGLLYMLSSNENNEYIKIFQNTIEVIKSGESVELIRKRLQTASDYSYSKQLSRIEMLISNCIDL